MAEPCRCPRGRLVDAVDARSRSATPTPVSWSARGRAPHPATHAAAARAGSRGLVGGVRWTRVAAGRATPTIDRGDRGRRPAARDGGARRGRRRSSGRPSCGTTPSPRPDAGWLVDQLPGGAGAWAEACGSVPVAAFTITKLSWLHRTEPDALAAAAPGCCCPTTGSPAADRRLVTDRGDASGTGYWSPARRRVPLGPARDRRRGPRLVRRRSPRVLGPARRLPATARGACRRRPRHRRQHGRRARPRPAARRRRDLARHVGHGVRGRARRRPPTPPAPSPGSPTPPAASCPLVCTLNATKVTEAVARLLGVDLERARRAGARRRARRRRAGAAALPRRRAHAEPARRHRRRCPGCAPTSTREQLARAAFEGVVCGLLDGLDALAAAEGPARWPAVPGGRWRPLGRLPPGRRRPGRPGGDRARRGRARGHRRLRPGRERVARRRPRRTIAASWEHRRAASFRRARPLITRRSTRRTPQHGGEHG